MKANRQSGQILLLAIIVVGLITVNTVMIAGGSQTFFQSTNYTLQSTQAINLAEAGIDKAVASLNASGGGYAGEVETMLGAGSFSVSITTPTASTKLIESTGYIPSRANPKVKRTIKITAAKGVGASFNYGVQVGEGGFEMDNNSQINGSVYSSGNIIMANNSKISGDAFVAGGTAPSADQQSDCQSPNCTDFIFGKNVNGSDRYDAAQSFKPSASNYLNKIALKLKKSGSPSDLQVKILKDSGGVPDKNSVLSSGTLSASLVTDQYGFVDAAFSSAPYLAAGTAYWILLDSAPGSGFWYWSADGVQGYTQGSAVWSSNWQDNKPVWNNIALDLGFKTYMGGVITYIQGSPGVVVGGNAHAHTLTDLAVTGGAYYQSMQDVTAGSFHPGSDDPPIKTMPISQGNLDEWKDQAAKLGTYGGINSCVSVLGPGKYSGDVAITTNGCNVVVKDPVWIEGSLSLSNNSTLKLDSSYGATSGVAVVEKQITLSNNAKILGSGISGSVLTLISTYDSRSNGQTAISVSNSGNQGVMYAANGIIDISNSNSLKELTAWKVKLENGVIIDYDSGLSSVWFSSGPSGTFSLVRGTYQLK